MPTHRSSSQERSLASRTFVIIGNGIAGVTAAETLRQAAPSARIVLITEDATPVYYRPALKDYLAGRIPGEKLLARLPAFYTEQHIECIVDRVMGIDVSGHRVHLQSGSQLQYDRLLLASGAHARMLHCPGAGLVGVTTLRTIADYQKVIGKLSTTQRIAVIGGGTLAIETVETLRKSGYAVSHVVRKRWLWSEVLDATASDLVLQQERHDDVDIHLESEVVECTGSQGVLTGIVTSRGAHIPCELALIAIGIEPDLEYIRRSGIACGRGVRVDAAMRTNAPDVYAAGDVVETTITTIGQTRLLGQWYPSIQQARTAAYSMLDILDSHSVLGANFHATFLYGLDFASAGITNGQAPSLQGMVAPAGPRSYRKLVLKDNRAIGMLLVGDRSKALAYKRAIENQINLQPVAAYLFEAAFDLERWLDSQGVAPAATGVSKLSTIEGVRV